MSFDRPPFDPPLISRRRELAYRARRIAGQVLLVVVAGAALVVGVLLVAVAAT